MKRLPIVCRTAADSPKNEAKAVLHNPLVTMLILPILERVEQIERRLDAREG